MIKEKSRKAKQGFPSIQTGPMHPTPSLLLLNESAPEAAGTTDDDDLPVNGSSQGDPLRDCGVRPVTVSMARLNKAVKAKSWPISSSPLKPLNGANCYCLIRLGSGVVASLKTRPSVTSLGSSQPQ